jgi:molybdopterin synthase sulfur carrier subunit
MRIQVLSFGIAKEITGGSATEVVLDGEADVAALRTLLETQYPRLKQLSSYMIALNNEYAQGYEQLQERDEIAIIPPVSGG